MKIFYIALISFFLFKTKAEEKYNRKSFQFHSYLTKTDIGFHKINIDRVVSLKDGFYNGLLVGPLYKKGVCE